MLLITLLAACTGTEKPDDSSPKPGAAAFKLSPAALDYPTLLTGQSSVLDVQVSNTGGTTLALVASVDADHTADYQSSFDLTDPAPGEAATLSLTLSPSAWGNYLGTLTVTDEDSGEFEQLPITALVQEDADGDGSASITSGGDDCDDTNTTVYPGATEIWYDDVDSDCAGDDDFDQDKDGHRPGEFGGDDCNDIDAQVYTGAEDNWYDGVDADCAGNNDYDQDADGEAAESGGGSDCDDTSASTYPNAPDQWYDGVDADCAGNNDYDFDYDGGASDDYGGDDCDDTNPSFYAGAPDTWYDGEDTDCGGNDDYDQDADGQASADYTGTDCNDTDSTIYVSATEIWYDGIDSDCGLDNDYDQDGDGHIPTAFAGDDCDDSAASTYPSAADTWYDGVDSDCAGNNDYDQDADGYIYGIDDCDDENASINPAAADTWYDGVDSDCAGNDDYDQDADGVQGFAVGGADCNDTDASVTGPEAEIWDDQDNDCSGLVNDFPIADIQGGMVWGRAASDAIGGASSLAIGGDLTRDGDEDLALSSTTVTTVWVIAAVNLVNGADTASTLSSANVIGTTFVSSTQLGFGLLSSNFADLNGDGGVDLLASGDDHSTHYGMSFSFLSPLMGSNTTEDDAASTWTGDNTADGTRNAAAGDLDGDGIPDVVTGNPYDYTYPLSRQGVLGIFPGPHSGDKNLINASAQINGTTSYDQLGWSVQVQDMDNDGYADILAGAPEVSTLVTGGGAVYLIPGGSLLGTLTVANVAQTTIYGAVAGSGLGTDRIVTQGDANGDGATDLLLTSVTNDWVGLWWSASSLAAAAYDADANVDFPTPAGLGEVAFFDFDGDGSDDVLIGDPEEDFFGVDAGAVWIHTDGASWSGNLTGFDAVIGGTNAGDALGTGMVGGRDFDGDGDDDLIVGAPGYDGAGSNSGVVYRLDLP